MYQTKKKSPAAHSLPQQIKPPIKHATQSRPAVAQLKTAAPAQSVKSPITPPVYCPQPVPKVLQKKPAGVTKPQPPVASRATGVVQRARDDRWKTKVTASFGASTATGESGKGVQTGLLLRSKNTAAAQRFEAILQQVKSSGSRTAFTCAEPNAVAKLLADAKGPKTVDELLTVKVKTAWDSTGEKDACRVCAQWIHNGTIVDLAASGAAQSASGAAPANLNLAAFIPASSAAPAPAVPSAHPAPAPMNYAAAASKAAPKAAPKPQASAAAAAVVVDTTNKAAWPALGSTKK